MPKETAELQLEYARSLYIKRDYRQAMIETNKFDAFYGDSDFADGNQFLRGEIFQAQGKYTRAARAFQQVLAAHPNTKLYKEAIKKQYEIGDSLYNRGQAKMKKRVALFRKKPLKDAITVYRMVVDNQPFTPEAAEAQYKIGLCHFTRKEYLEAAFEYRRVVEDYSSSEWVNAAQFGLAQTYYTMAQPADYDQTPSQLAIDNINTFLERYPADKRGEEMKTKKQEMHNEIAKQRLKAAQFYERRREFDSARLYYALVVEKYPDTPAAKDAKAWLDQNPQAKPKAPVKAPAVASAGAK
jgi:outer membrane assembly lipoprotein YfiO